MVYPLEIPLENTFTIPKFPVTVFSQNQGVDKSSSQFNNAGIKPKTTVKNDYSIYYIGGAFSLILLLFILIIARKV